jgi:hypothetical protein
MQELTIYKPKNAVLPLPSGPNDDVLFNSLIFDYCKIDDKISKSQFNNERKIRLKFIGDLSDDQKFLEVNLSTKKIFGQAFRYSISKYWLDEIQIPVGEDGYMRFLRKFPRFKINPEANPVKECSNNDCNNLDHEFIRTRQIDDDVILKMTFKKGNGNGNEGVSVVNVEQKNDEDLDGVSNNCVEISPVENLHKVIIIALLGLFLAIYLKK